MKAAFACWNGRIAPVLDTACRVRVVEAAGGAIEHDQEIDLPDGALFDRARHLADLDVDTVVCGAVSRPLASLLAAHGITVIAFVGGDLGMVIPAWASGQLDVCRFALPGCGRRRPRRNSRSL